MKWSDSDDLKFSQISGCHDAVVQDRGSYWTARIETGDGKEIDFLGAFPTEAAAKAAVPAWIGKTIAQLGNALAAGEPRHFEDDGA